MAIDHRLTVLPGASAPGWQQAALLVDADNFSDVLALESAWGQLQARAGRVSVCRAYGAPARLQSLAGVWRILGARTFPNLALEKNTTDAALITDAVALHFQQGVRLFAIASGDADFAPLAVRLREWGCEVWCFSMNGILFAGAEVYYDRVVRYVPAPNVSVEAVVAPAAPVKKTPASAAVLVVEKSPFPLATAAPAAVFAPALSTPVPLAPATALAPLPPVPGVAKGLQSALPLVLAAPAPVLAMPKPKLACTTLQPAKPLVVLPDMVRRVLQTLPALRDAPQMLSQVVPMLRQKSILGKTTKSTAFFASYSAYFKLSPAHQPTLLAYVPPRHAAAQAAAARQVQKPTQTALNAGAMLTPTRPVAVISGPTGIGRRPAPPLLAELHGLRSVLIQRAVQGVTVADVLLAVPELLRGQPCALSAVAGRLREKGLLHPSQSALRILERHPNAFGVEMGCMPQAVVYLQ